MATDGGGWTVFQRRRDGVTDFYRGWIDYERGFGNPENEFWLGNGNIHALTSQRRYQLRIDLKDFDGNTRYAVYSTFSIGDADSKYKLTIGGYTGTAGYIGVLQQYSVPMETQSSRRKPGRGTGGN
ncbi:ficolin-1-like [Mytilus trossulus]|uniref:ficolin-1-like n=1 Tax=Mytilus trossulus TaxID=6551 RepID=UPI0030077B4C